jgi:hypothetical protein
MPAMTAAKAPARLLPLLYLGTAHLSLALACLLAALWPRAVAGFFYHSWMVALVHLVTLGWITFSILGAFYIVGPLALRMEMPSRRLDVAAYAFNVIGLIGMVAHFWIESYSGMAWSAGMVVCGVTYMTARIARRIAGASVQPAVKLHITLACVNFWIAASLGLLLGVNKAVPFLPGFVLSNVFAHAHLAALGWAAMMVMGVGYRLLPMILPAKMPAGRSTYASAIVLEAGVLGLFVTLLLGSAWATAFGFVIVAGLLLFAAHVVWMLRHRVPAPVGLPRPDFAVLHAAGAGASLLVAAGLGLLLLMAPPSTRMLQAAAAYGALGLVGFLAQMVVAMEARLLPTVAWFWAYAATGYGVPPPSPHTMRDRVLQSIVFAAWSLGAPSLAAGLFLESARLVALGAWALFVGVTIGTLDSGLVVGSAIHAGRRSRKVRAAA